jgi:hypothetical protein
MRKIIFSLALAACSSTPEPVQQAAGSEPVEVCRSVFAREAECTDLFIPMLVDARIRHDLPAGITARAAQPGGREALIAAAKEEWKTDGAEPARSATCQKIASHATPQMVAQGKACLARGSCADFVACMAPFHDARLAEQK